MASKLVECLNCGMQRRVAVRASRPAHSDECGRCGYVGWAKSESLDETLRRALREHSVEQRRHAAAW
jgi:Zn ribbon nucleic-acid-binding protein